MITSVFICFATPHFKLPQYNYGRGGGGGQSQQISFHKILIKCCFNVILFLLFSGLVPPAVRFRGSKAIAAYRRALEKGKTRVVRVRIILIGATGVGKTSLLNALHGKFKMEAALDEDELMARKTFVYDLVPSWEASGPPTRPWGSYLEAEHLIRKVLSQSKVSNLKELLFSIKRWQPPSGPYMDWPTHHLKGNANTLCH